MRSGVKQERKEGGGCLVGQIGHHRQTCAGPEPVLRGSGSNAPICGPGAISHVATLYPMTRWKSRYLTSVGRNHMGSGSTPKTSTQGTGAKLPFGPRLRMRSIVPIPVTIAYTCGASARCHHDERATRERGARGRAVARVVHTPGCTSWC